MYVRFMYRDDAYFQTKRRDPNNRATTETNRLNPIHFKEIETLRLENVEKSDTDRHKMLR